MTNFLLFVQQLLGINFGDIWTKLVGIFSSIVNMLEDDEAQILHDAITQYTNDRAAGKTFGVASADALSVFFNEEKGEVSKLVQAAFNLFLAQEEAKNS